MDNQNFEQQFTQNIRATAAPIAPVGAEGSKLPLVIAIALAAIVLVESIALIITISNYFTAVNEYFSVEEEIIPEGNEPEDNGTYVYDENTNLIALNITCATENGAKFNLTNTKKIEQYDSTGSLVGSGNYSILNDSIISITGSNSDRTLYYDGFVLADGTTLYNCEEVTNETSAE